MHTIMQQQAGTRAIYAMTNGRMTLTTHYSSRAEFEQRLAEKNEDAKRWGELSWCEVIKK